MFDWQKLKHGKILCGQVFSRFVETFNMLIDRSKNIKGDYDTNPLNGHIKVDNEDPAHPVIRFVGELSSSGGKEKYGDADYRNEYNVSSIVTETMGVYDPVLSTWHDENVFTLLGFKEFHNDICSSELRTLAEVNDCVDPQCAAYGSILLRKNSVCDGCTHTLNYADLRDIYPYADSDMIFDQCAVSPFYPTGTESIEKNGQNLQKNVFQVYGFDWYNAECSKTYVDRIKSRQAGCDITNADLLFRRAWIDTGTGCTNYQMLYTDLNQIYIHADNEPPFDVCGCLYTRMKTIDKFDSCGLIYHTLHGFSNFGNQVQPLSSSMDVLVRKRGCDSSGVNGELQYVELSNIGGFIPDSEKPNCTRSLQKNNQNVGSLYNFDKDTLDEFPDGLSSVGVLCRRAVCDTESTYNVLEYYSLSSFGGFIPDSEKPNCTRSLQKNNQNVGSLYNFGNNSTDFTSTVSLSGYASSSHYAKNTDGSNTQFLCRQGGVLKYANLNLVNGVAFRGNHCACENEWHAGMQWNLYSASDSNVQIKVEDNKLTIGVYYV